MLFLSYFSRHHLHLQDCMCLVISYLFPWLFSLHSTFCTEFSSTAIFLLNVLFKKIRVELSCTITTGIWETFTVTCQWAMCREHEMHHQYINKEGVQLCQSTTRESRQFPHGQLTLMPWKCLPPPLSLTHTHCGLWSPFHWVPADQINFDRHTNIMTSVWRRVFVVFLVHHKKNSLDVLNIINPKFRITYLVSLETLKSPIKLVQNYTQQPLY